MYSRTLSQCTVTHLTHVEADRESEDHPHSTSHSHIVAEMLDLPLEQALEAPKAASWQRVSLTPEPSTRAGLGPGQAGTAQQKAAGHFLSVFATK